MNRPTASALGPVAGAGQITLWQDLLRLLLIALGGLCLMPILMQGRLLSAIGMLGGWLVPLALLHTLPILLDSRGWLALIRLVRPPQAPSGRFLWGAALIREAVGNCLPFSGTGAFAAALRLLALRGIPTAQAIAAVVVESTLTLLTQTSLMLVAIGAWLSVAWISPGLCASALELAVGGVLLSLVILYLQRSGRILGLLEVALRHLAGMHQAQSWTGAMYAVYEWLDRIYKQPRTCLRVALWQLAALGGAVAELALMLSLLHLPHPVLQALSLSAVAKLARSPAVMIPAGLGLQELAFGGFLMEIGLDFHTGVAISVATRARDLMFGLPVVLAWVHLERNQRGVAAAADAPESRIEDVSV